MKQPFLIICLLFMVLVSFGQETDSLVKKKNKVAVYPVLAYSPESEVSFGAIAFIVLGNETDTSSFYRPTSITPFVVYTTRNQILVKSEFDVYFKSGLYLGLEFRAYRFPDLYYGIGNETDPDFGESYGNNFVQLEGNFLKPYSDKLFYGVTFDWQYNQIEPASLGLLENDYPNGVVGGRNIGLGPAMIYDSRNSTLYPTKGKYLNVAVSYFGSALGGEFNHVKYLLDFRHYFELPWPKSVLTYQLQTNLSTGRDIPFYKLNVISGENRLRGFNHNRVYTDRQSAYFQVEARQELFWRLGGVIFAGVGEVFGDIADFNAGDLRYVYGLGGRFRAIKDQKLNIRIDLGFSDDGQHAFYLSVREAF